MTAISAVILAGGQATRMGGRDKGLVMLNGRPLIEYTLALLEPVFNNIIINANRHAERYAAYGHPVVQDELPDYMGPLAGMLTALHAMKSDWLFVVACDMPFLNRPTLDTLLSALPADTQRPVVAHDGERLQPMLCLLHKSHADSIADYLASGEHRTQAWFEHNDPLILDFSEQSNQFTNLNSEQDMARAGTSLNDE